MRIPKAGATAKSRHYRLHPRGLIIYHIKRWVARIICEIHRLRDDLPACGEDYILLHRQNFQSESSAQECT